MKTTHIALLVAVLLLARRRAAAQPPAAAKPGYLVDSSDWYSDQWARIYGADLMATDAQSPHSAYGMTSCKCTGFNA
jgi:hypothetical protein